MLLTPDSYLITGSTGQLLQVNGYTITFNGLSHILHLSAGNGNTYKVGVIEAEWLASHPECFL
jgi:hypothetical protein